MRIAYRLAVAISMPCIIFAVTAGKEVRDISDSHSNAVLLNRMASGVTQISSYVHSLQRERGMTNVVASTKGAQMLSELTSQRKDTDTTSGPALGFLATLDDAAFATAVAAARSSVAKLADIRKKVDSYTIAPPEAFASYTAAIANLLALSSDTARLAQRGDTASAILAYVSLQQANERAGQERASTAAGIAKGKFDAAAFARMAGLQSAQDAYIDAFRAAATPQQREAFTNVMAHADAATVNKMRETVRAGAFEGDYKGLTASTWFAAASARMALIAKVENGVANDLLALTRAIETDASRMLLFLCTAFLLTFAATVAVGYFVARGVTRPLRATTAGMAELAKGNFAVHFPNLRAQDELGEIGRAAEAVVEQLGGVIRRVKASARDVNSASNEISMCSTDLSTRTEEQAASLEETSAAMEEMTSTVKKNSDNARQASDFAAEAATVANRGSNIVSDAVKAMAQIEESSCRISDIITVIDEIARQTNLLALNAAVEAARAGDAGRGFAVVASEVRNLAQRSASAAKDITALISSSTSQVGQGVQLVNRAGGALSEIVSSIGKVSEIVREIAHASAEQSTGLEEINRALMQLDTTTQQNSALVEESAATAMVLKTQADGMREQVDVFRLSDNDTSEPEHAAPAPRQKPAGAGGREASPRARLAA